MPACTPDALDAAGNDADANAGQGQVGDSSSTCSAAEPKAHISVHVQTPSDNPVNGVTVSVDGHGWSGVTDANGDFDFGEVPPDTYTVTGELTSGNISQTLNAPAGASTLFTLTAPMAQIAVHVQTPTGDPVKDVTVSVDGHGWSGVTDANGDFNFGEVPPDTYTVTGEFPSGNISQTLNAPQGTSTQFTLTAPTCPTVEIQINNTPTTNDDLVRLKCDHPAGRFKVNCQIRATGAGAIRTVVLTNPDGRLRFPESGDTTKNITLPGDGSWVPFQISGELGSSAIGDAVVEVHCQTATGALLSSKPVTVFWFDSAQVNLTPGGPYQIDGLGVFTSNAPPAIAMSVQAKIQPAGVDCTAPQAAGIRIGMVQNANVVVRGRTVFGPPTISWNPGVAAGTAVTVPLQFARITNHPIQAQDSATTVLPLYDQPGKADTLSGNSLKPPIGCAGGGAATSFDTPTTPTSGMPFVTQSATNAAGVVVGTVKYPFKSTHIGNHFVVWAVAFDTATNDVCLLRERNWDMDVDSVAVPPQPPTAAAADTAPTIAAVLTPPFSGDVVNNPANQTLGPDAAAGTTTITFPNTTP